MKRIGRVTDLEFDLENRSIKQLIVKVDGGHAKKGLERNATFAFPKDSDPAELVSEPKTRYRSNILW